MWVNRHCRGRLIEGPLKIPTEDQLRFSCGAMQGPERGPRIPKTSGMICTRRDFFCGNFTVCLPALHSQLISSNIRRQTPNFSLHTAVIYPPLPVFWQTLGSFICGSHVHQRQVKVERRHSGRPQGHHPQPPGQPYRNNTYVTVSASTPTGENGGRVSEGCFWLGV